MSSLCDLTLAANVNVKLTYNNGLIQNKRDMRKKLTLPAVLEMFDRKNISVHEIPEPCWVVFTVRRIKVNVFHSYSDRAHVSVSRRRPQSSSSTVVPPLARRLRRNEREANICV